MSNVAINCSSNPSVSGGTCQVGAMEVAPAGTYRDNFFNATYVDVDTDVSTFMSSSDSLNLPVCSEISWAGLFWGASQSGTLSPISFQNIKLKSHSSSYTNITASSTTTNTGIAGHITYHCFSDVTSLISSYGIKSRITIADIFTDQIGELGKYGSWTLVVFYKNELENMRQLSCYEGLVFVDEFSSAVNVPISGFFTPISGAVTFETGVYVHDGDRSLVGDNIAFNGGSGFVNITNTLNPLNDVMNGTCSKNGIQSPFMKPFLPNTSGLDADIYSPDNTAKNYLGNAVSSATFQLSTAAESYLVQMISTAIDVYEPDLRTSIRVTDSNGGTVQPGDVLEYKIKVLNVGSDPSINTFVVDTIERNANYIPNSLKIIYGPNTGVKSDFIGDDQAEYNAIDRIVKARVGVGANGSFGGRTVNSITGSDSTVVSFSVTVTNSCVKLNCDNIINANSYVYGTGEISGNSFVNDGSFGIYDAFGCSSTGAVSSVVSYSACTEFTSIIKCENESATLLVSNDTEVTYNWIGPNSFTSLLQNPFIASTDTTMTGIYTVTLTAYSGCSETKTLSLVVNSYPHADFNILPSSTVAVTSVVNFENISTNASSYSWAFGDGNVSTNSNPTNTYNVEGSYIVTLVASNGSGCNDTIKKSILVNTLFIPNGFTPDGDTKNENFVIKGLESYPDNELKVFNRWGNLVYSKKRYDNSWNGFPNVSSASFGNGKLPASTYYYILEFNKDNKKPAAGFVVMQY